MAPTSCRATAARTRVPNPDERQPKVDEFSLNLEHELMPNLSVRVTGVYSRESNLRRLLGVRRPYGSYSIPVTNPDPGPDGARRHGGRSRHRR